MIHLRKPSTEQRSGVRAGVVSRLAMFGLALVGLVGLEGCQSSGCSGCGVTQSVTGFTQRVGQSVSNFGARVFHRNKYAASSECCEGGTVMADPGMPVGTVIPGPVIQSPGSSGSTGTEISPELSPASPSSTTKPATPGAKQGAIRSTPSGGNARMSYETERPVSDGSRSVSGRENVASSLLAPSESSQVQNTTSAGSSNPLDNLPPVELPRDVARRATAAPVPLEAEALVPPASARNKETKDPKKADAAPAQAPPAATSASAVEPPSAGLALTPIKVGPDRNVSPGIQRFTAVGPSVAGGSSPTKEGLDWLKEKGYRTFLDLRERSEIDAAFVDEVINRGLRYVPLPVNANRLDEVRVNRFREELAQQDSRPLYFCDTDGSRPALLWYVHRMSDDGVEASMARREAEEIAPISDAMIQSATRYIGTRTTSAPAIKAVAFPVAPASTASKAIAVSTQGSPETESLLGRSAVLTFTRFEGLGEVKIPEPKSLSGQRVNLPNSSASPRVSERNRSADQPESGD